MNLKIRKSNSADWEIIQKLNNYVFENDKENDPDLNMGWPYSKDGISYYQGLASGKSGFCLIAEIDGQAVGYVALSKKDFGYRKSKYIEIENIGVAPEFRSQGIGQKLIMTAEDFAKREGANKLYVSAFWKNKRAIKYYKNNGFVEIGVELEKEL